MSNSGNLEKDYVKKETMLIVAFITLIAGFLGGVSFGIYRSGVTVNFSDQPMQSAPPVSQKKELSAEQANRISAFLKETSQHPESVDAWTRLGDSYFDANDSAKAIDAYQKSLAINPNNANVMTDLGIMYRRNGEPKKAIESFDKAMIIAPRHEPSRFNKGVVLLHDLSDPKGAVDAWKKLVDLNPTAKTPSGMLVKELLEKVKASGKS
ncbi:tetratricopeptide repeat protein [Thermodesulfobacteriota bacterium]